MPDRLLALQHQDTCPPGWFGDWLKSAGVTVDTLQLQHGAAVPESLGGYAGLMVLGGRMGALDDEVAPWLPAVRTLIATVVRRDQPFLGICLGHQLAAAALGGRVERSRHGHSRGLTPLALAQEAATDPLLAVVPRDAVAVQWNYDVVVAMPPGAAVLATAPDGTVQAARFGPLAWGVQFHPEASPAIFRSWTVENPHLDTATLGDIDLPDAVARVAARESRLRRDWAPLARRFAAITQAYAAASVDNPSP